MGVFERFKDRYQSISIVGMAKNAGKTVTLNHVLAAMGAQGCVAGITSIGRDGERQDIVTHTEKPTIWVEKGTLVATSELLFNLSEAKMEIVEVTPYPTAMGRVIIGRALTDGHVQIGGPATNSDIRRVSERMLGYGAQYILVDGALDRASSASPAITEACILSTGAVVSRRMAETVAETAHRVALFGLPEVQERTLCDQWDVAFDQRRPLLAMHSGALRPIEGVSTAIHAGRELASALSDDVRAILIPGALVAKTVLDVVEMVPEHRHIPWMVGDATRIFISRREWKYFMRVGVDVRMRWGITLLAVTANPYAPAGYFYDSERFVEALSEVCGSVPVYDVLAGAPRL